MPRLELYPLKLDFPSPVLADPAAELVRLLSAFPRERLPPSGAAVALLVGSRKIANLAAIIRALAAHMASLGLTPTVVPAMGSHGGGTPGGQLEILRSLGITEDTVGARVVSSDRIELVGYTKSGVEIWADSFAIEMDAIIPVNRVKPHTAFRGRVESGPSKMLAVGLGKERSARLMHMAGLEDSIPDAASALLASGKIPLGVAVVENPLGETAGIALLERHGWLEREAELLESAWALYPRLPWKELDLLIVERIGKDISGTGMDLNVIGMGRRFPAMGDFPVIKRVVALSLTEASFGNGTGVGYADIVTRKLAEAVDLEKTGLNCAASGFPEAARIPCVAESEKEAITLALEEAGNSEDVRAVRIRDTSNLAEILVTKALLDDWRGGCR